MKAREKWTASSSGCRREMLATGRGAGLLYRELSTGPGWQEADGRRGSQRFAELESESSGAMRACSAGRHKRSRALTSQVLTCSIRKSSECSRNFRS